MKNSPVLLLFFIVLVAGWSYLGINVLITFSPFSPVNSSYSFKERLIKFLPQGWGFFTRNPREASLFLYQKSNEEWILKTHPNLSFSLGAGRNMRFEGAELGYLLNKISERRWTSYATNTIICWDSLKSASVQNDYIHPSICGEVLVKSQQPIPWAWSKSKNTLMPYRLLRLDVICSD